METKKVIGAVAAAAAVFAVVGCLLWRNKTANA